LVDKLQEHFYQSRSRAFLQKVVSDIVSFMFQLLAQILNELRQKDLFTSTAKVSSIEISNLRIFSSTTTVVAELRTWAFHGYYKTANYFREQYALLGQEASLGIMLRPSFCCQ